MFSAPFTAAFALTYSEAFLLSSSLNQRTPLRWYLPCLLSGNSPPLWMRSVCHWRTVLSVLWIILLVNSAALVTVKDSSLTRTEQRSMATACLSSLSRVWTPPSTKSPMISLGVRVSGVTSGSAAVDIVDSLEGPLISSVAALSLALAVVCSCWVRLVWWCAHAGQLCYWELRREVNFSCVILTWVVTMSCRKRTNVLSYKFLDVFSNWVMLPILSSLIRLQSTWIFNLFTKDFLSKSMHIAKNFSTYTHVIPLLSLIQYLNVNLLISAGGLPILFPWGLTAGCSFLEWPDVFYSLEKAWKENVLLFIVHWLKVLSNSSRAHTV